MEVEVIVVDNASEDGSADMIRQSFPQVRLIENHENRFFSAAYNQAFQRSEAPYVLALNSDVQVEEGSLSTMLDYLKNHPSVDAVTGGLHGPDGALQPTCARFASLGYLMLEYGFPGLVLRGARKYFRGHRSYRGWDRRSVKQVEVAPGSFLMFRRAILSEIGGFDERLRLYFSDDDWCLRLAVSGGCIHYLPAASATHEEMASSRLIPSLARRTFFEDLARYGRKHFGRARAAALSFSAWPVFLGISLATEMSSIPRRNE